ncbi:hypothetical protein SAMN05518865_109102 [Duganella sp. CF458]|uniref:hypothetical protein n=1 Tax=Duganella sp. CF458 TaxID=1884368 RepID=UPI0008E88BF1|nr:hypothetical protein [Duganella sp. CF458]SFG18507.1 hypothetical protein SAMN05518865_109102 [Duganella sp. CF458]
MRPGWKPTRRNRNAGTKANGLGRDNNFDIPFYSNRSTAFFEQLANPVIVRRRAGARELLFIIEPVRAGFAYPCTIDDIVAVLTQLPAAHQALVDYIVLRQPTRKQEVHSPAWGRAIWNFEGKGLNGPAIILESRSLLPYRWGKHIDPERARELARLRDDGHEIVGTRRGFEFRPTPASLRNTVLFRTLLHELGHHVDYWLRTDDGYYLRTLAAREDFAHRYASEAQGRLQRFAPIVDPGRMRAEDLQPAWFTF